MLQKLLDLLKLDSFRLHQEIAIQSIIQDEKDAMICTHIDYHNQHESAVLIGLFHATSSVLTSVESYQNYRKPTQRGVQGYLSSLQRRVEKSMTIKFHENALKQFSRRLKFMNLASEPQKNLLQRRYALT